MDRTGISADLRRHGVSEPAALIHLFTPEIAPPLLDPAIAPGDRRALWSADSVHRANNLAQLAVAMAGVRAPGADRAYLEERAKNAATLAEAYAELAEERSGVSYLPCADLLARVAWGLTVLFAKSERPVAIRLSLAEVALSCERRRAMVLIASELVVNALKYAFPGKGGTITVSLSVDRRHATLTVEDDGIGMGDAATPGSGTRILDELAVLLEAPVERTRSAGGGLRVSVHIPLIAKH